MEEISNQEQNKKTRNRTKQYTKSKRNNLI